MAVKHTYKQVCGHPGKAGMIEELRTIAKYTDSVFVRGSSWPFLQGYRRILPEFGDVGTVNACFSAVYHL